MNSPASLKDNIRWSHALFFSFLLRGAALGAWLSRLPAVQNLLDASVFQMSILSMSLASGSVIGLLSAGRIVSRLSSRITLYYSQFGFSLALITAVIFFWFDIPFLGEATLLFFGFMYGISDVAMNVNGSEAERELHKIRMPYFHAGFSLGGLSAMLFGAFSEWISLPLLTYHFIVAVVLLISSAITLKFIKSSNFLPTDNRSIHDKALKQDIKEIWKPQPTNHKKKIIFISLILLAVNLVQGGAADWIPLALVDSQRSTATQATAMLIIYYGSMTLTRLFGSLLVNKIGELRFLWMSSLLCAIGIAILIVIPSNFGAIIGATIWGIGIAAGQPICMSIATSRTETAVRDVSIVSTIGYLAFIIGPMTIGAIGQYLSLLNGFWVFVIAMILVIFMVPMIKPSKYRRNR